MLKQVRAVFGTSHRVKPMCVAILILGLLGISPSLARAQDPTETIEPAPPLRPPIGVSSSSQNPLQIALLHWYNANLTTQFKTASNPTAVAFDGASIWVANNGSKSVTKLRASDRSEERRVGKECRSRWSPY